jgi:hypothetical protein
MPAPPPPGLVLEGSCEMLPPDGRVDGALGRVDGVLGRVEGVVGTRPPVLDGNCEGRCTALPLPVDGLE